jgi:hypothetical protein
MLVLVYRHVTSLTNCVFLVFFGDNGDNVVSIVDLIFQSLPPLMTLFVSSCASIARPMRAHTGIAVTSQT